MGWRPALIGHGVTLVTYPPYCFQGQDCFLHNIRWPLNARTYRPNREFKGRSHPLVTLHSSANPLCLYSKPTSGLVHSRREACPSLPKHFPLTEICGPVLQEKGGADISIPNVAHISKDATSKHHPTACRLEAYLLRHRMRKR